MMKIEIGINNSQEIDKKEFQLFLEPETDHQSEKKK